MNLIFTGEHGSELNIYEAVVEGLQVPKSKFGRSASVQNEVWKVCKFSSEVWKICKCSDRSLEACNRSKSKFAKIYHFTIYFKFFAPS